MNGCSLCNVCKFRTCIRKERKNDTRFRSMRNIVLDYRISTQFNYITELYVMWYGTEEEWGDSMDSFVLIFSLFYEFVFLLLIS